MYANVFYFANINSIGGIETMFWMLARKYGDRDITVLYRTADPAQLRRMRELVRCVRFTGQRIRCRKAFFNYTIDIIDHVDADEYNLILHADYSASVYSYLKPPVHEKIDHYLAVSQVAADGFKALTGIEPAVIYNPFIVDKPRKVLRLISATRLTPEKGKARMELLAQALDAAGIPWRWDVYTNDRSGFRHPNITLRAPRLGILDDIADADYLVQLSDSEAYSYSIVEALAVGTPVIVTAIPVCEEMGIQDGVNAFVLPFDMSEIPVAQIYKGLKRFKYTPRPDCWPELLAPGASSWPEEKAQGVTVEATQKFIDLQADRRTREKGERWTCSWERCLDLEAKGLARLV